MTPTPRPTEAPVETRSGSCGKLCSEEFWEGGVTPAAVRAELDRGADPLAIGDEGIPALAYALFVPHGHEPAIVRLLLEAGADPNFTFDDDDLTLLHIAVMAAGYASHAETADRVARGHRRRHGEQHRSHRVAAGIRGRRGGQDR